MGKLHYDATTREAKGYYLEERKYAGGIPTPNIDMSIEDRMNMIEKGHNKVNLDDTTEKFDFRTIKEIKASKQKLITSAVQSHLDAKAIEKGYESILSACSYSGHTNPFQAEGQSFVEWRGNVWAHCYQVLAEVEAGTRAEPTVDELLAELPALVLP